MTCTCRANNCDEFHAVCVCGCTLGRAQCRNADEFLRGLVEFRRSEAAAPTVSQATGEQTTALRVDARGIDPTVTPRSEYYDQKRVFPF